MIAIGLVTLLRSYKLRRAGDDLAKLTGWSFANTNVTKSFEDILAQTEIFVNALAKNIIIISNANGVNTVLSKFAKSQGNNQFRQAAFWLMEDISTDVATFANKKITFEYGVSNARITNSESWIDVMVGSRENGLWLEYKWLESATVSKATFISQFIERDLFSLSSLQQLQWRIKGQKLDKATVKLYMESTEGLNALNDLPLSKKELIFPSYNDTFGVTIDDIDNFLNINYNVIFK